MGDGVIDSRFQNEVINQLLFWVVLRTGWGLLRLYADILMGRYINFQLHRRWSILPSVG